MRMCLWMSFKASASCKGYFFQYVSLNTYGIGVLMCPVFTHKMSCVEIQRTVCTLVIGRSYTIALLLCLLL